MSTTLSAPATASSAALPDAPSAPLPSPRDVLDWLNASPTGLAYRLRAKERAANPPKIRSGATLLEMLEHGEILISTYARGMGLVFRGSREFIAHLYAWAVNTGVISPSQQLHWYSRGLEGNVAYICPRDRKVIKRGLMLQMAWEIVRDREVPVEAVRDPETGDHVCVRWNESKVAWMAARRAVEFYQNHIKVSGILLTRDDGEPASIYHLRMPGREGASWGTGTEG